MCRFQSTRPHGARHCRSINTAWQYEPVSIHAPARGATWSTSTPTRIPSCFNPRARTGRDWPLGDGNSWRLWFQSTRPHGARLPSIARPVMDGSFNPRARTGRDGMHIACANALIEFQSTRPHGARHNVPEVMRRVRCFNPRARTGRDSATAHPPMNGMDVSIHAPARGATLAMFQLQTDLEFQSTRPHGARHLRKTNEGATPCFNPRARTGRDGLDREWVITRLMFQSTRPHGARPGRRTTAGHLHRFNPRARTGRDLRCRGATPRLVPFQSTRPHGARPVAAFFLAGMVLFQSTRPHGARHGHLLRVRLLPPVSIHAPARGATPSSYLHVYQRQ